MSFSSHPSNWFIHCPLCILSFIRNWFNILSICALILFKLLKTASNQCLAVALPAQFEWRFWIWNFCPQFFGGIRFHSNEQKLFRLKQIYCFAATIFFLFSRWFKLKFICMFAQTEKLCKPQRKPFWMRYILWLWYSLASVFVFKLNQDLADLFEDKHFANAMLKHGNFMKISQMISDVLNSHSLYYLWIFLYRIHLIVVRFFFTFKQYIIPIIHNAISMLSIFFFTFAFSNENPARSAIFFMPRIGM